MINDFYTADAHRSSVLILRHLFQLLEFISYRYIEQVKSNSMYVSRVRILNNVFETFRREGKFRFSKYAL